MTSPRDPMTLARLGEILDAYGARSERWPEAERAAALALVARAPEARALVRAAAGLDALLDGAPAVEPSADLAARIVAVPARVRVRPVARTRAALAAGAALAAAASLAVWLARESPPASAPVPAAVAQLDLYDLPSDAFLAESDPELDDVPAFGCEDPDLGCDDVIPAQHRSQGGAAAPKEMHA